MIVKPKQHYDGSIKFNYGDFLAIECEVVNPPSSEGRTVYVFFDDEDVTKVLLELRSAAIRRASAPSLPGGRNRDRRRSQQVHRLQAGGVL